MDYISREDALKWCRPEEWDTPDERWRPESEFGKMIKALPAADVVERNAGTWIIYNPEDIGTTNCRCSNCRTEFFYPSILIRPYAYCPNCGARMEGNE